jgi:hypothetical protein
MEIRYDSMAALKCKLFWLRQKLIGNDENIKDYTKYFVD